MSAKKHSRWPISPVLTQSLLGHIRHSHPWSAQSHRSVSIAITPWQPLIHLTRRLSSCQTLSYYPHSSRSDRRESTRDRESPFVPPSVVSPFSHGREYAPHLSLFSCAARITCFSPLFTEKYCRRPSFSLHLPIDNLIWFIVILLVYYVLCHHHQICHH